MPLTNLQIKNAKAEGGKSKKLSDGGGLFLLVTPSSRLWRFKYTFGGKEKSVSFGKFPMVSLADARAQLVEAKELLRKGINPSQLRQDTKAAELQKEQAAAEQERADAATFEVLATEWLATRKGKINEKYGRTILGRFERYVFPFVGGVPIGMLERCQLVDLLLDIANKSGTPETAKRVTIQCNSVLRHAITKGVISVAPIIENMNELLPKVQKGAMPAITKPQRIGELLRAIDSYQGTFTVCCALRLLPYLFVRAGEFRKAEWQEFNLDDALWTIPANHRKQSTAKQEDPANVHYVPLSVQAVAILREIHQLTGHGLHVFPSARGDSRPMCENTINAAFAAMGFKGEMVGHGWRSAFSTCMNSQNFNPDMIERQLAHVEPNKIRRAYNRDEFLEVPAVREQRTDIMQAWANYLDALRTGADVVSIRSKANA